MRAIIWHVLNLAANLRGLLYRWPRRPASPPGYSTVSCGLQDWRTAREMYEYGWIPWSVQRARSGADDLGISRVFLVRERSANSHTGSNNA